MQELEQDLPAARSRTRFLRYRRTALQAADRWPEILEFALPLALVAYLGASNGGYDVAIRGEMGVAAWWLALLAAILGLLPRALSYRWALLSVLTLAGFAVWTTIGIAWSESAQGAIVEAGRVATYVGVLLLAITLSRRGSLRRAAAGTAAGITVVATIALLSRMQPQWFPEHTLPDFLPDAQARLNFPVNYWNGLAALCALGLPLLLHLAANGQTMVTRAFSTAALPLLGLTIALTLSRGGWIEAAAGLLVLFALYPRRLELLPSLALGAAGAGALIASAARRDAFSDGLLTTGQARSEGTEMLLLTIAVCVVVFSCAALLAHVQAKKKLQIPALGRRTARRGVMLVAGVLLIAIVAAGASGELDERWQEFKAQGTPAQSAERLESASGNGRYQYWSSSLDAMRSSPLGGIGPGSWELWWAREGDIPGFVRNSHSLWFDVLAETGLVGLLLLSGFFLVVGVGTASALRRARPRRQRTLAASAGAMASFIVAASIDWVWQLGVITFAFLLLAGATLASRGAASADRVPREGRHAARARLAPASAVRRLTASATAIVAIVLIGIPVLTERRMNDSAELAAAGDIEHALEAVADAQSLQPYALSPRLREAWLLELDGRFAEAAVAAQEAIEVEPTNWRPWLVLSRIEEARGNERASTEALRQTQELYPRLGRFGWSD